MARNFSFFVPAVSLTLFLLLVAFSSAFKSDELLLDDEESGLEGGRSPDPEYLTPIRPTPSSRRKSDPDSSSSSSPSDSKSVQFLLDHAFGNSEFALAGTFTARLKTSAHGGGSTLTKLRFSRNAFTAAEKEAFERILKDDDFYTIRLPSSILDPPGKDYIVSSVRARCLARESLDEHFVIHMEGVNILAVNYGSSGACQYPRLLKVPAKWSFNSYALLKYSEEAKRTPTFAEELLVAENGEGEGVKPIEKSFWAKYWMYLIPLGLIVMNAFTAAMNMPEEQASGSGAASQVQQSAAQRTPNAAVRRR